MVPFRLHTHGPRASLTFIPQFSSDRDTRPLQPLFSGVYVSVPSTRSPQPHTTNAQLHPFRRDCIQRGTSNSNRVRNHSLSINASPFLGFLNIITKVFVRFLLDRDYLPKQRRELFPASLGISFQPTPYILY